MEGEGDLFILFPSLVKLKLSQGTFSHSRLFLFSWSFNTGFHGVCLDLLLLFFRLLLFCISLYLWVFIDILFPLKKEISFAELVSLVFNHLCFHLFSKLSFFNSDLYLHYLLAPNGAIFISFSSFSLPKIDSSSFFLSSIDFIQIVFSVFLLVRSTMLSSWFPSHFLL